MAENLSLILLFTGTLFMLLASIGVARLPDLFMRLHSSTKSATLGVGCIMLGAALHFGEMTVWMRALAVAVFLLATAPVAAHLIGRAAYLSGAPLWAGTLSDDLRGRYDVETHVLSSFEEPPSPDIDQGTHRQ